MKTFKNLYGQICSFDNLLLAAKKAQKGKRYKNSVARFNIDLEKELVQLRRELIDQTYCPGKYHHFTVYESKKRLISAAPYRDRVVHHALCNIIEPLFDNTFIYDSYACRKGKGTHKAVERFTEFARKNRYVFKCDIRKYFTSTDHPSVPAVSSDLSLRWAKISETRFLKETWFLGSPAKLRRAISSNQQWRLVAKERTSPLLVKMTIEAQTTTLPCHIC